MVFLGHAYGYSGKGSPLCWALLWQCWPPGTVGTGRALQHLWRRPVTLPSHFAHSIADPQVSDAVLRAVAAKLKMYPFDFRGAKILSGEEEGVFGWVTANYLLENFIKVGRG